MDFSQTSLGAGPLASLVTSAIATPVTTPYLVSYSHHPSAISPPVPSQPPQNSHLKIEGDTGEWSSLIGIITALAGNVLISLALNIQRYAHLRIAREWEQDKVKKEAEWRRNHPHTDERNSYGTVEDENTRGDNTDVRYSRILTNIATTWIIPPRGRGGAWESPERLRDSFTSDRTARPGDKDEGFGDRKSYLQSPYWWVGIILMCLGETGNFMAYGFAPASIVSPLGVVALISNCVIAPCLLKEKFRQRDFWGVLISIAGAVVVVLSAKSSEEKIGPDEIWTMITRWEFELYLGLTVGLIIGLMWASFKYGARSILIDVGLVALFGGYTALSTKGVSSLLTFSLWHVITFPITYLLVFVLVSSALMQIRYINRALQRFDSTQVIPTQFVLFTLSVIIGSAILYRDFESMSVGRAAKFVGGCLMTFLGVYFITSGRVRSDDESTFSTDDEEEAIGLLHGERYQDRVDLSPPGQQLRAPKGPQAAPDFNEEYRDSPSGSLLSRGVDGIDDEQPTPRGILSAASSSPDGSLPSESPLSGPSFEGPSPLRPPSRMSNPWVDIHEQISGSPGSDPEIHRPVTPPSAEDAIQESTVLLRFPRRLEWKGPRRMVIQRASTPAGGDQPPLPDRSQTALETPTRNALRNSISNKFSPGPLLPTLSGGFSAVVAESLRRGEGGPFKDRVKRKLGRRKQLDGAFDGVRYQDGPIGGDGTGNDTPLTIANARLQSATSLATPTADAGRSTPALTTELYTTATQKSNEVSRLRSFSDSWSGGLAWLGGALRTTGRPEQAIASGATTHGAATPSNNEGSQGGDHPRHDSDAPADTR
ncbi:hypothetical protein N7532_006856 [Penicillium argentinense]|uniref:DUF803 domain membrane protein n=1 Tax=Penicillium argentinense TaxID=1131581 RepID=A0A9W9KB77_9EURO|nr:uncharacterized protein N7532_006856 [Penicillium argentinense]KAJ5099855.1 hypothetical protein N7532_006856 [Penicillium argentinense]